MGKSSPQRFLMPLMMSTTNLARFFWRAPVLVVAPVPPGRQEVHPDVGAAHVEVDAVEAGLLRALGGVDVLAG